MSEEYRTIILETRQAKIREAEAYEQLLKALRQEIAALGKMASLDKPSENR